MADGNPKITFLGGGTDAYAWINENTVNVGVYTAVDQDHPNDPITWSIIGGDDAALFVIDEDTGVLNFLVAPDFEQPLPDNLYEVEVHAENDNGPGDDQLLFVQVLDVADGGGGEGPPGPPGEPGTDGVDGTDGTDGTDGVDGTDGTDGTDGVDGAPGPEGPVGPPGPAGDPNGDGSDINGHYIKGTRKPDVIDANSLLPSTEFNDIILGRKKGDDLFGLGGNDAIVGGKGRDLIVGGLGDDLLWGGKKKDTFAFNTGDGNDIVKFHRNDVVNLAGTDVTSFGQLQGLMTEVGGRVLITFDAGNSILLGGFAKSISTLDASDFEF